MQDVTEVFPYTSWIFHILALNSSVRIKKKSGSEINN